MGQKSAHRSSNNTVSKLPYHSNYYAAANRLQSDNKRHKTPSFNDGATAVRLSNVDRYLMENFRSLYEHHDVAGDEDDDDDEGPDAGSGGDICRAFYINEPVDFSPRFTAPPREVIRASKRFFASPGLASSLVEEARLSAASRSTSLRPSDVTTVSCSDSTAVIMESRDPYDDFRRSMGEMVMAHHADVGDSIEMLDWDFMEELLFSYLNLNDRSVHKDVLRAFVDVTAGIGCTAH